MVVCIVTLDVRMYCDTQWFVCIVTLKVRMYCDTQSSYVL